MINEYNKKSDDYIELNVNNRKIDDTFSKIDVTDKNTFLESLRAFQKKNPNFLTNVINREFSSNFWK